MADLGATPETFAATSGGSLSGLARAQYAALAAMRTRLLVNRLRSNDGVFELGARALGYVLYGIAGLGLGVGTAFASYAVAAKDYWGALPVVLWMLCILWQAVAITLASLQEQFDLSTLLRFPMNFGSFYALCVLFSLLDTATIMGALGSLGVVAGLTVARPDMVGWNAACMAVFGAFNVMLSRAILAWIDRWLAKRRSREIISGVFLVSLVCLQLLNPALHSNSAGEVLGRELYAAAHQRDARPEGTVAAIVERVQRVLPPGIAAAAVERAAEHRNADAAEALGALGFYALAVGGLLALRLRAEYSGENLGEASSGTKTEARAKEWTLGSGGPVSAVMEKDLRTLLRSMPQLYAVGVPLVMVYIIANLFSHGGRGNHFEFALPVCVAYALLGFAQLMYNNLGAEGQGIQSLFLYPVPVRTVMLAKNLFHGLLFVLVALLAGTLASLRLGAPTPVLVALTLSWLAFALPANLAAGNVLSVTMAYRVNLGRIGRQSGSQANGLLSMLIQMTVLGVGAGVISVCSIFDRPWLGVPILLVLAAVAVFGWLQVLRNVDAMANARRDQLLLKLVRAE